MSLFNNRFFSYLIRLLIPTRTKRLVFLTSLVSQLVEKHNPTQETLHKLNALMNICTLEDSMRLPVTLSDAIWSNKTPVTLMVDIDSTKISASNIINKSPRWLKYGKNEDMVKDIETILNNYKELSTM